MIISVERLEILFSGTFYEIGMLTQGRPRMPWRRVMYRERVINGNEFSSGVFGGVSTCGDSDGLRARAPRRSPVREERSDAKDVGKIDSPSQRGSHSVSVLWRDRHTTGEKPAPKIAGRHGHAETRPWNDLTRAIRWRDADERSV